MNEGQNYYNRAFEGEAFDIEEHFYHPNINEIQYAETTFQPLRDESGEIIAVSCASRNITKIVKLRTEANQLIDSSLDVLCIVSEQGVFQYVSAASVNLWGYTPSELIGKSYKDFILEEDLAKTNEKIAGLHNGQDFHSFTNRYRKKNGEIAYNLWSARWDNVTKLRYAVAKDYREEIELIEKNKKSEERFKALVQEGADIIGLLDANGYFTYISPTCVSVLGISPSEFIGKQLNEFIHPEDLESVHTTFQKIATQQKVAIAPFRIQNSEKKWRWIETVLSNMTENSVVKGIVSNSRDVTERIEQDEQMEQSKKRFESLVENSMDCIIIISPEGKTTFVSGSVKKVLGYSIEEVMNLDIKLLVHPEDLEGVERALIACLNNPGVPMKGHTSRVKHKNGTWRWIEPVITNLLHDPSIQGIVDNFRDITDLIEEQHKLKLFESVITNTKDAIVITEAKSQNNIAPKIVYINEAFTTMTGYKPEEIIGKTPEILNGPNSTQEELDKLIHSLSNWEPCELTILNYKKNREEFWVNISVTPVANELGVYTHWVAIERDVTEQVIKEQEKELLAKINVDFSSKNDLKVAANELCKTISAYGKFDLVEVWTVNLEKVHMQLLSHFVVDSHDEIFYTDTVESQKFKISESLGGQVWLHRKELVWNDIDDSIDFIRKDDAKKIGLKSILGIPLVFNDELVGVMKVGTKKNDAYLKNYVELFKRLDLFIGSELQRKKLENDLNHLFNAVPDIICLLDTTGKFLKINQSGCQLLGFDKDEILLQDFDQFSHPEEIGTFNDTFQQNNTNNSTFKFENRYITKNGETVWLSWYCNSDLNEELIYATANNITEEKKLRELNRQASELAKIGSWEINLVDDSLFWSDEVHKIHGTDPKTFKPSLKKGIEFYREDFRQLVEDNVDQCILNKEPYDFEAILITTNKEEKWVRSTGNAEFENGICKRIYGSFQEIDARKRSQLKLAESENKLRTILEAEPECVKLMDEKGKILMMNPAGLEMIEAANETQILNQTVLDIVLPEHKPAFMNLIKSVFRGESGKLIFEIKGLKGTKRWMETHAVPMRNEKGDISSLLGVTRDITEQREAQIEIIASEERRRLIMSGALDAIICILPNQEITFWNPQAESIFGWKESEAIGQLLPQLIIPEAFRKFHEEGVKNYMQSGQGKVLNRLLELTAIRKNGDEFPIELTIIPIEQDGDMFFCAFIRDLTNRKKAEEEKNSLMTTIENSLNEIYIFDTETLIFSYVNTGALNNLGYTEQEIKQLTPINIKPDFTEESFRKLSNPLILKEKEKIVFLTNHKRKDGSVYPVEVHLQLVTEHNNRRFLAIIQDITERKETEEIILKSNERFEMVTEATNDAIWDWDIVNNTFYRSKAIEQFFGHDYTKISEDTDFRKNHFHPDDLGKIEKSIELALANPLTTRWENEYRVFNEKREILFVIDRGVIIRNKKGKAIRMVGAMTDISKQKQMELELIALNEDLKEYTLELEASNEYLEQFAFIASHDLQEPLRMISSFMNQLKRKYEDQLDDKALRYIHFATDGAARMKQIILDLLDYSRSGNLNEEAVAINLNQIIDGYKVLRRKVIEEKNVVIISDELPEVTCYLTPITLTFHCLLDNAIKYAKVGQQPTIRINVTESEKHWTIGVKDNGIGIEPQFFDKIFILFQRLHNRDEYNGTGIGLAIAKKNIESCKGKIWVESTINEGSTFYFTINKMIL